MTEFVLRRTGRTHRVGAQLDQDGEAVVNAVEPASSDLALKQYLPDTLQQRSDLEARVHAMIDSPPAYRTARSGHERRAEDDSSVSRNGVPSNGEIRIRRKLGLHRACGVIHNAAECA